MSKPVHLIGRMENGHLRSACFLGWRKDGPRPEELPRRFSWDPADVTCKKCKARKSFWREAIQVRLDVHAFIDGFPGFAGFLAGSLRDQGEASIRLNLSPTLYAVAENPGDDLTVKRLLIEHLMHEFGHALEEHFGLLFDEDAIEAAVASYESDAS